MPASVLPAQSGMGMLGIWFDKAKFSGERSEMVFLPQLWNFYITKAYLAEQASQTFLPLYSTVHQKQSLDMLLLPT